MVLSAIHWIWLYLIDIFAAHIVEYDNGMSSSDGLNDILPPKSNTRSSGAKPWPKGVVPYLIDSAFSKFITTVTGCPTSC